MKGKLIIIEGLDGSGKATQAELLFKALQSDGATVRKISFPNYKSPACNPVKMYLAGEFGSLPEDVNAYAASSFYAIDRYASYKTDWKHFYNAGGVLVSDRYTTSNAVHQCCKLPKTEWDFYLDWLFDFEYNKLGIPVPDLVIYLDMSVKVSQKLMSVRYHGDLAKKDIHERDEHYLSYAAEAARYCAGKLGWKTISCDDGEIPYSIEQIAQTVFREVKNN